MQVLNRVLFERKATWIREADISAHFDSIDRKKLMEMLRLRIADEEHYVEFLKTYPLPKPTVRVNLWARENKMPH